MNFISFKLNIEQLLMGAIGIAPFVFGIYQWLMRQRIEKLQSRFKLMEQFYSSATLHKTFQEVDYENTFLGPDFAASEEERRLDQLLLFLDHVERCWKENLISEQGYHSFEYFFNRVKDHHEILSYLKFHRNIICETTGTKVSPFSALLKKFESEIELAKCIDIYSNEKLGA